ncbi:MAG: histidine kinase dimerization/phospho-acceptor domain-containing protein [Anaerolineaceae bacterium]
MLFYDLPKLGPSSGVELIASWLSSRNLSSWLRESNLFEESVLESLVQPNRTVVITGTESDPRLKPLVRDLLVEGEIHSLIIFPLVATGDWIGNLLVFYQHEQHFDQIELHQLKVLVGQATITLYNLKLLEVEGESRREAERANEIKSEFLAMITHELRTPLTPIISFTTTLLADDVSWEPYEQRDFIQTIKQEADRLQELIDHLLDFSRLEAGMLPISLEPVSLHEIIEDALLQIHILTSSHTLTIQLPDTLPLIYADPKRISQVLVNLVRNAALIPPMVLKSAYLPAYKGVL